MWTESPWYDPVTGQFALTASGVVTVTLDVYGFASTLLPFLGAEHHMLLLGRQSRVDACK
ncbi:hypothetical protein GCM10022234_29710 [Aeromicrobium panaciterrae]